MQTLKNRTDFLKISKSGRKWVSHGLILQAMPNEAGEIRVGYTVTKKTEKSAVRRNRIKRRLRAAAREVLPEVAAEGHDYVLIGRNLTAVRPFAQLTQDLKWCLEKMELNC